MPTQIIIALSALYLLDRWLKAGLVARFFARPRPLLPPGNTPTVALIQPVTRGATDLRANLTARAALEYSGVVRHIAVCDAGDAESQAVCRAALPGCDLILAEPDLPGAPIATKVGKMAAGVAAMGSDVDVVCFVDDDIRLPPDALTTLVAPLYETAPAGATFGLACQMSWDTPWESLMSGFVNANALTGYVPLVFFTPPYTVTGHVFALRRDVWERTSGMSGLEKRFDDDHEIARRVRALGLPLRQTPLVYGVSNALPSLGAYRKQMRRWFVMPKQAMAPYLTPKEQTVTTLLSLGNLIPPVLLFCALFAPCRETIAAALLTFALFLISYLWLENRYLPARTPYRGLFGLPVVAFLTPLHVLIALVSPDNRITWRGRTYRAGRSGELEADDSAADK
jgi:ceramide glucosyltransferase